MSHSETPLVPVGVDPSSSPLLSFARCALDRNSSSCVAPPSAPTSAKYLFPSTATLSTQTVVHGKDDSNLPPGSFSQFERSNLMDPLLLLPGQRKLHTLLSSKGIPTPPNPVPSSYFQLGPPMTPPKPLTPIYIPSVRTIDVEDAEFTTRDPFILPFFDEYFPSAAGQQAKFASTINKTANLPSNNDTGSPSESTSTSSPTTDVSEPTPSQSTRRMTFANRPPPTPREHYPWSLEWKRDGRAVYLLLAFGTKAEISNLQKALQGAHTKLKVDMNKALKERRKRNAARAQALVSIYTTHKLACDENELDYLATNAFPDYHVHDPSMTVDELFEWGAQWVPQFH